jgi:hypothetical protein
MNDEPFYPIRTEFYLIDFEQETVELLPTSIENAAGDPIAIVDDKFYFSYFNREGNDLQGLYFTKLPD